MSTVACTFLPHSVRENARVCTGDRLIRLTATHDVGAQNLKNGRRGRKLLIPRDYEWPSHMQVKLNTLGQTPCAPHVE
jgi:hypothetical protein